MRKIRFFERNLYLSVDLAGRKVERVRLIPHDPATQPEADLPPEAALLAARGLRLDRAVLDATEGDALAIEIEAFLAACAGEGTVVVDGEGGLRSLEVALRVREAVGASLSRLGGSPPR
jgi:hypothetical protein